MRTTRLTRWIMLGMALGVLVGYLCNTGADGPESIKEIAGWFALVTDIFLRLIRMIIAPLVFATLVSGIASMGDSKSIGRIGVKAIGWFAIASFISLSLGLVLANILEPGRAMHLALPDTHTLTNLKTSSLNIKDFIAHVFPRSIVEAMATNEILQIVVFALFFGFALAAVGNRATNTILSFTEELARVMIKITDYVMLFAPIGVFAAVAGAITTQGLGIVLTYGQFLGSFYVGLLGLWLIMILVGYLFLGKDVSRLLMLVREPALIAFSTASSESAYPKMLEQLERFGISERITGFVLPLGYSFNLDGSMMYMTFAVLFVAQAYGIDMSLGQQISMILFLMISSKGMAGVARASLVVVAATLPAFNLPEAGLLLIMGVDQFLDMGRTATNVIGNSIATAVIAKWEGGISTEGEIGEEGCEFAGY
jgi:Na+/H+-dicarboxylate symporter